MLERSERVLKIICLVLAAIMLYELASAVLRHNPLEHMSIPVLPALAAAPDGKTGGPGTNSSPAKAMGKTGTNSVAVEAAGKPASNAVPAVESGMKGTNSAAGQVAGKNGSNAVSSQESGVKSTNSLPVQVTAKPETNLVAGQEPEKKGTNAVAGTNLVSGTNSALGTNGILGTNIASGTNVVSHPARGNRMMNLNSRQGPGKPAAELPPVIQARIDKITDSEILGPVIRPVPLGLLGIAGEYAFLRAPSGQTEMVKEGAEMGGIKLLKIGINRVLVEEAGEKKELSIFEGYGGETLLPKPTDKPNEIITKPK